MNIYKLRFSTKEEGVSFFQNENLTRLIEDEVCNQEGVHAIVDIGRIVETPGEMDNDGNIITEPTYLDGFHFDIMCEQEIISDKIVTPSSPSHKFGGN
ncbi:MAG: hypothetical protein ACI8WA_000043 [Polaribacter sp.]|jgi:hypothetical protein